jgi:aspartyl-tRNA(Asn)/glutamyl-tRNA(Gln) amidotransferase subunit A
MPDTTSRAFASIRELAAELRSGSVSSLQLTTYFLDRLQKHGPTFNAVVRLTRDVALEQAKQADEELKRGQDRGPLHGIPYAVKDLLATKGIPTSWGAAPRKDQIIDADASVVSRLRAAGAVLCAKLSMVEMAGGFGYKQANASFTGPGLNAWDKSCWSGGSSSGSGSAIGAGLIPFAIGSETWGSIMTPSGYNGIAGLRPTYGRVSRHGAMALSWTMDKLGPMCRTADDCGLVLNSIAGPDPLDPTCIPTPWTYARVAQPQPDTPEQRRFRFATLDVDFDKLEPEVRQNYERSLEVLKRIGLIEEIKLPDLPYSLVASTIISCEMGAAFGDFMTSGDVWELTAPEDRWGGFSNLLIPARDYINALRIRGRIKEELDVAIKDFDAIITPTLNTEAGPITQKFSDWSRGFVSTDISGAANAAGLPGITVPNGFGVRGLPTGLEFTGRALSENAILGAAVAFQQRTDWHKRTPTVD